jgi:hypothetical protein
MTCKTFWKVAFVHRLQIRERHMQSRISKEKPALSSGFHNKKFTPKYSNNHMKNQSTIDFDRLKSKMMPHILALLSRLLPGGRIVGHEYVVKNPKRHDKTAGSFRINTHNGKWSDFAINKCGKDIISLWAYIKDIRQIEAARELLVIVGDDND